MTSSGSNVAHATVEPETIARALLEELLGPAEGGRFLVGAISDSGREFPRDREHVVDYARNHLVGPLTLRVGPRLVTAFVEELRERLVGAASTEESTHVSKKKNPSPPSSSVPSSSVPGRLPKCTVLVHLDDRFARASLARALVRAGATVETIDSEADVAPLFARSRVDVAVVDGDVESSEPVLAMLAELHSSLPVIVLTKVLFMEPSASAEARRVLLLKSARPAEIAEEIRILLPARA